MSENNTVAIVVPVYNEAAIAAEAGARLAALARDTRVELCVVDGNSDDDTAAFIRRNGVTVIDAPTGRARQMNTGAANTRAPTLLFLHLDTELPATALDDVASAVANGHRWGRFDVRIVGKSIWFPLIAAMMNLRTRLTGHATGDQAIFVQRRLFDVVGRFPEQPLMEDVELSRRLRRREKPACINATVATSGRRWEQNGVWRTVLLMWRLRFAYWRGVPAEKLATRYV